MHHVVFVVVLQSLPISLDLCKIPHLLLSAVINILHNPEGPEAEPSMLSLHGLLPLQY